MSIFFNGKRLVKPQAASKIDISNLSSVDAGATRNIYLIGQATGGVPGVIQTFNDPSVANAVLRGGDLLKAVGIAWSPSPNQNGASVIKAIRINAATQSVDTASSTGLTVTTKDYGIYTKSIQYQVTTATADRVDYDNIGESVPIDGVRIDGVSDGASSSGTLQFTFSGTTSGTTLAWASGPAVDVHLGGSFTLYASGSSTNYLTVTVTEANLATADKTDVVTIVPNGVKWFSQYTPTGAWESQENLGPAFTVRYTGNAATCKVTVTVPAGAATTFAVTSATTTESFSLSLSDSRFTTVSQLVNYLNGTGYLYAEVSPYLRNQQLSTAYINAVDKFIRVAAKQDRNLTITAKAGAIIDWALNESQFLTVAQTTPGAELTTIIPMANVSTAWTTPGAEGSNTATQWTAALTLLENEDADIIVPLTADTSLMALVSSHVENMSVTKRERRAYYGTALGYTKQQIKALASTTNSRRALLVTPGVQLREFDGTVTTYPSYIAAAAVAGIMAGFDNVAEPATYKLLNIVGMEKTWSPTDIDELLDAGVAPLEYARNLGWRICQGRTTYTKDNNVVNVEDSVSAVADYVSKDLRTYLENRFIGQKATTSSISSIESAVVSKLKDYERSGIITGGIDPTTGTPVMAYRNINISFSNRTCIVTYEISPVEPINYITITAVFKPATIVV